MKLTSTLKIAIRALRRNVMRAVLTMLGIIIGVSAVIAMMEIGQGSSREIQKRIASMGANNIMVQPGSAASGGITWGAGSTMTLTPEDCEAIQAECPAVKSVAPTVNTRAQVVYGNRNWQPPNITGTSPEFLVVRDWDIAEGDMFTDRDVRNSSKVCVIGLTLKRELFEGASPIGKELRIKNVTFKVVGVLSRKGANMMGFDQDDTVLAPWTTVKYRLDASSSLTSAGGSSSSSTDSGINTLSKIYPSDSVELYPQASAAQQADTPVPVRFANVDRIMVAARSSEAIPQAIDEITRLLRQRHRLRADEPDDFNIRDMTEMTNTLVSTTQLMTRLLLSVAMISLLVGGVGIMNIMLVSVTERTREIGLRMAVGARARDILQQFLVESVVLCLAGGAIGIALGRGFSVLLKSVLNWPTATSVGAVVASVLVSATVGIVFGYYPAWKASKLDPIEALRYE